MISDDDDNDDDDNDDDDNDDDDNDDGVIDKVGPTLYDVLTASCYIWTDFVNCSLNEEEDHSLSADTHKLTRRRRRRRPLINFNA